LPHRGHQKKLFDKRSAGHRTVLAAKLRTKLDGLKQTKLPVFYFRKTRREKKENLTTKKRRDERCFSWEHRNVVKGAENVCRGRGRGGSKISGFCGSPAVEQNQMWGSEGMEKNLVLQWKLGKKAWVQEDKVEKRKKG